MLCINLTAIKYKNITEKALARTDIVLTLNAILAANGINENTLPNIKKNGVPGGCGTCNKYEDAINSPQSQNDTEGWTVEK